MAASSSLQTIMARKSTEATLSLGWVIAPDQVSCLLYAVCKGVSMTDVESAMAGLAYSCGNAKVVPLTAPSGTHAEMQIVRSHCSEYNVDKSSLKGSKMQIICIGKKICKDCGGFLNKYSIPNLSVLPPGKSSFSQEEWQKSTDYGDPSQMWSHPTTKAVYSGGKNIDYYSKGFKSFSQYS